MAGQSKGRVLAVLSPAKTLDLTPLSSREFNNVIDSGSGNGIDGGGESDCGANDGPDGADGGVAITGGGDAISNAINVNSIMALYKKHCQQRQRCSREHTEKIVGIMKQKNVGELKQLLSLSANLADTAYRYWSEFNLDSETNNNDDLKPAIFTFSGPAFQGLSPQTCNMTTLSYLASNLFILDPVYGVLRSLDDVQPYRLEMGCKCIVVSSGNSNQNQKKKDNLASFWKEAVTSFLSLELKNNAIKNNDDDDDDNANQSKSNKAKNTKPSEENDNESQTQQQHTPMILANLASEEYSSSIDPASLPSNTIFLNVIFRHKGRVISVHSKRARGLMARYLAESNASSLNDISEFDVEGYSCVSVDSSGKKAGGKGKKKSEVDTSQFWETVNVVGDNVQIVQMIFDREDVPSASLSSGSGTKGKRLRGSTTTSSKDRKKRRS